MYHILFMYSSIDGNLDCFHLLVFVNNAAKNMVYKFLFESLLSMLLGIYLELELVHYKGCDFHLF